MKSLKLKPLAIGSLPYKEANIAMDIVKKNFYEIPFFPQLSNINKFEDMMIQVLEGFPGLNILEKPDSYTVDSENEEFFTNLEEFFTDYEEVMTNTNSETINKYKISEVCSSTFPMLLDIISQLKPDFAKGQIVGPFTLSATMTDTNGTPIVFDETLRDIIVKLLSLKAVWLIKQMKKANHSTTPIIFMDEPSISQLGTSAYLTIQNEDVIHMIKEISDIIHDNGGLSAIHCCGKCEWFIPINAGIDILNLDAYSFSQHFSLYSDDIEKFLKNGGKIAWGLVPTLDNKVLSEITTEDLTKQFENSVTYLTNKGIDEKLITDNSLVTSSCGAGSLTEELAMRAMNLIKELSDTLRERF